MGEYLYDVFLSLRGDDCSQFFTTRLRTNLVRSGFRIFIADTEMAIQREILEETIKQSMVSIIIFSKNYLFSNWCLDILAMIHKGGHRVYAVYLEVDPAQLRDHCWSITQTIDWFEGQFKVATPDQILKEQLLNKLKEWAKPIGDASLLTGMTISTSDELESIQKIIEVLEGKHDTSGDDVVPTLAEGSKLKETPKVEWKTMAISLSNNELSEVAENPFCPTLKKLVIQNPDLAKIPLTFFESTPALQVLDLSYTSIKCLPPSISRLLELREFYLRGCRLLMELPPEIGALINLKLLDLEGTALIYVPNEIGLLINLECLKVSLCRDANKYIEDLKGGTVAIIPRATLSKLRRLNELCIDVDPDCGWWDVEVEAIMIDLCGLTNLERLKLYLPTVELLQKFWQVTGISPMSNFRLIVGRHERPIISVTPKSLQTNFENLAKSLKYVNGEGNLDSIAKTLRHARALFLDRNWTIERLPKFIIAEINVFLHYLLLVECHEMKSIVDGVEIYEADETKLPLLGILEYLSLHCMKKLACIWKGPIVSGCLSNLTTLALHSCPQLSTIFTVELLENLIKLKQLIVEDCPKIESVVSFEYSGHKLDQYLPSLCNVSLIHLPKLVSVSCGLCIGQKLERMIVYNCPKLKSLLGVQIFNIYMKEVKGKSDWWEALEWHKSDWNNHQHDCLVRLFVPLGRDDDLMDQLEEAMQTSLNSKVDPEPEGATTSGLLYLPAPSGLLYTPALSGYDFPLPEMWRELTADTDTRIYVLQPDFVLKMLAFHQNRSIMYPEDNRFMQALDVFQRKLGVDVKSMEKVAIIEAPESDFLETERVINNPMLEIEKLKTNERLSSLFLSNTLAHTGQRGAHEEPLGAEKGGSPSGTQSKIVKARSCPLIKLQVI